MPSLSANMISLLVLSMICSHSHWWLYSPIALSPILINVDPRRLRMLYPNGRRKLVDGTTRRVGLALRYQLRHVCGVGGGKAILETIDVRWDLGRLSLLL
jgi:hypothetical protein